MLRSSFALEFPALFAEQQVGRFAADSAGHAPAVTLDQIGRFIGVSGGGGGSSSSSRRGSTFFGLETPVHSADDERQIIQAAVAASGQGMHALLCRRLA